MTVIYRKENAHSTSNEFLQICLFTGRSAVSLPDEILCDILWCVLLLQTLKVLYEKLLLSLQKIPEASAYRRYTEQIANERLQLVKAVSVKSLIIIQVD